MTPEELDFNLLAEFLGCDYTHTCECGRVYRVWRQRIACRDHDSIECACGRLIKEWNEAKIWHADLINQPSGT